MNAYTPRLVENILWTWFWHSTPSYAAPDWLSNLNETLGIQVPEWAHVTQERCLTHGDPTFCNVMRRQNRDIVLCDMTPPVRVPEIQEIDQAKILQSMLGWEGVVGGRWVNVEWQMPLFIERATKESSRRLAFWLGVTMARNQSRLSATDTEIDRWCELIKKECVRAAGI